MPQYDSKQWEHLISQDNDPSWSDFAHFNLYSISGDLIHEPSYLERQLGPRKLTSTKMDDLGL